MAREVPIDLAAVLARAALGPQRTPHAQPRARVGSPHGPHANVSMSIGSSDEHHRDAARLGLLRTKPLMDATTSSRDGV
jgi:hypothetical protein